MNENDENILLLETTNQINLLYYNKSPNYISNTVEFIKIHTKFGLIEIF